MPELDEALLKRIMPHDDETEQSLLGVMLMDQEKIPVVNEYVSAADFYNRQYGAAFQAMVDLYAERMPVDPITLHNRLAEMDVPPEVTTMEFINALVNAATTSEHAKAYAQYVAEKATFRKLIRLNEEIAATCYAGKTDLEEVLETTETKIFDLLQRRNSSEYVPIRQVVTTAMDNTAITLAKVMASPTLTLFNS